jgi:hypothetical protein
MSAAASNQTTTDTGLDRMLDDLNAAVAAHRALLEQDAATLPAPDLARRDRVIETAGQRVRRHTARVAVGPRPRTVPGTGHTASTRYGITAAGMAALDGDYVEAARLAEIELASRRNR